MLAFLIVSLACQEPKELNDAARSRIDKGATLELKDAFVSAAIENLALALQTPVVLDRSVCLHGWKRKITIDLKAGTPALESIESELKKRNLAAVLFEGVLFVTTPESKVILEKGVDVTGPPDEELKKDDELWKRWQAPIEVTADTTVAQALDLILKALDRNLLRGDSLGDKSRKVGFPGTRTALRTLRLILRADIDTFELKGNGVLIKTHPRHLGAIINDGTFKSSVVNARAALLSNNETMYKGLLKNLQRDKERHRDIAEEMLEAESKEAVQKALQRIIADLK